MRIRSLIWFVAATLIAPSRAEAVEDAEQRRSDAGQVRPGAVWRDTDGNIIQAHSAGLLFHDGVYYWYGENKSGATEQVTGRRINLARVPVVGVSCYSSRDLIAWRNEGVVLRAVPETPGHDLHPSMVCERPKVLFNERSERFVMWWHVDSIDYQAARAGVAIADRPEGPFVYQRSFRPLANQTFRDMNLFLDDDGAAYVYYASEGNRTLYVSRLNAEFTDIERPAVENATWRRNLIDRSREAPAPFKHAGRYYLITSGCTGWQPNRADLAVASHPLGPYESLGNPCVGPGAEKTFFAQSTFVLPLPGRAGTFLFLADRWRPEDLGDSRYVWLPFRIGADETVRIEWRDAWDLHDWMSHGS